MSGTAKREYFEAIYHRYQRANRKERSRILDEACAVCGISRKHAIRQLATRSQSQQPQAQKRSGRPPKYQDKRILDFLVAIWKAANLPCGKRIKSMISDWLPAYQTHHPKRIDATILPLLMTISAATIDRLLASHHGTVKKHGFSTTRPGTLLKHKVTIRTNQWDESRPGFVEVDSVAHCGSSMAGMFVYTINVVDIATAWGEQAAVWGRGERGVVAVMEDIENDLPFPLRGFDCDNGGEFLNHHMYRHLRSRKQPVEYTRARPYKKNDNAHIEEKNWTRVRQYLGYGRFENPEIVPLLNDLYRNEWRLLQNFFLPSVKLISKERLGAKIIKRHDEAQTPYQRILKSTHIHKDKKEELRGQFSSLDPFQLQEAIRKKILVILRLASSEP